MKSNRRTCALNQKMSLRKFIYKSKMSFPSQITYTFKMLTCNDCLTSFILQTLIDQKPNKFFIKFYCHSVALYFSDLQITHSGDVDLSTVTGILHFMIRVLNTCKTLHIIDNGYSSLHGNSIMVNDTLSLESNCTAWKWWWWCGGGVTALVGGCNCIGERGEGFDS